MEDMSLGQSIWIGLCQIFSAVFPGTSRSMSTIAGGQVAGMSRPRSLEFSFFLSIPTMAAATLYTLYKSLRGKGENPIGEPRSTRTAGLFSPSDSWWSFVVAYGSVAWFMDTVRKRGFARSPSTGSLWARWCWYSRRGCRMKFIPLPKDVHLRRGEAMSKDPTSVK